MLLFSCNVTKNINKDEKLLVKNKIKINHASKNKKKLGFEKYEIAQIITPKPNSKILFLPVKMWIYQLYTDEQVNEKMKNKRKKKRKKEHWTRRVGEPPVYFSVNDEYKNPRKIRVFLRNKGYYSSSVKIEKKQYRNYFQEVLFPISKSVCNNKKLNDIKYFPGKFFINSLCKVSANSKNKISVKYIIETGNAHRIDSVKYNIEDKNLEKIVLKDKDKTLLKKGKRLDVILLEDERKRISAKLRNSGYYTFSKDYIYFSVDTIGKKELANITINILTTSDQNKDNKIKKHIVKNVYIYPNFKLDEALVNKDDYFKNQDTLEFYTKDNKKYNLIYKDVQRINKKAIVRGLDVASGDLYNLKKIKSTYKHLASLPIIQTANITFHPSKKEKKDSIMSDSLEYIDCEIRLSQDKLQSYQIAGEVTNTSRNFGFASSLNYTHNNFFRRMEVLDLKFNVEFRHLTKNPDYEFEVSDQLFNSRKYGAEFNINFPRLFFPDIFKTLFKNSNAKTNISGNFNYTERPDYTWAIAGGTFGYNWESTSSIRHYFLPLTADYFYKIENYLPDIIDNRNYDDRFILGGSYKFVFNNQYSRKQKDHFFITAYTKIAGNSIYAVNNLLGNEKNENGNYTFFGNAFAQFVKAYIDARYYKSLGTYKNNAVFRIFAGAALPYGNLNVIPFNEQFFSGGSTGLRAWDERSLGPGSYVEEIPDQFFYQKGDIKFEANVEYRKKVFKKIETAVFVDAGNVWAINSEDTREGALFEFNDFYKEIAIGTGFGVRYDFGFFIIRVDIGMKLRNPALPLGNRWLSYNDFFTYENMKFNIGIGYPF